jgi:hypothetical protein
MVYCNILDSEERNTRILIESKNVICIPTVSGRISVSVFNLLEAICKAMHSDDSDRSFMIKK